LQTAVSQCVCQLVIPKVQNGQLGTDSGRCYNAESVALGYYYHQKRTIWKIARLLSTRSRSRRQGYINWGYLEGRVHLPGRTNARAGSCHKRQKAQAPTPQAPIRNRQTRKVANARGLNRNTNLA